jgi:AAA domain/PLD-like domain
MDNTHKASAFGRYWRNSLADAAIGRGALAEKDAKDFMRVEITDIQKGRVSNDIVQASFKNEPTAASTVEVVLRPLVYVARTEHGQRRDAGMPAILTPVITPALLTRDGRIYPIKGTLIARDVLEPLARGYLAIGTVECMDKVLTEHPVPAMAIEHEFGNGDKAQPHEAQWAKFVKAYQEVFSMVCGEWSSTTDAYLPASYALIAKRASTYQMIRSILDLYDHLHRTAPKLPLFDRYASSEVASPEPCLAPNALFAKRLGHASDRYPLAVAQRDALAHVLSMAEGEILAVNGPPGTGKTTLVLSVVASLWAKAALDGGDPPVILAASTNNQAVTNIIDAFGKDFADGSAPFAGRWLPAIRSFGAYFPSAGRRKEAATKYQTEEFFDDCESTRFADSAEQHFLLCAKAAFPDLVHPTVQAVVTALHQALQDEAGRLANIELRFNALAAAQSAVRDALGGDPERELANRRLAHQGANANHQNLRKLTNEFQDYLANEPLWLSLFSWLPPVAVKRLRLAKQFIHSRWPAGEAPSLWATFNQMEPAISQLEEQSAVIAQGLQVQFTSTQKLVADVAKAQEDLRCTLAEAGLPQTTHQPTMDELDSLADRQLRFKLFSLTKHYWEGRWLCEMKATLPSAEGVPKKTGAKAVAARWRQRMMLTPCAVSTFHSMPNVLKVRRKDGEHFVDDYLYNFVDLLIVDEAGQVTPEVAGASFALAKKALVIGDTKQLDPIWSVPQQVDIGNLHSHGLLSTANAYQEIERAGKAASSGSVMRIAQAASRYHYDTELERGLYLFEHRRCYDEIIAFSNALCYGGKLIPTRGPKPVDVDTDAQSASMKLPALGYLHVNGKCVASHGGSRENLLEAQTISEWLVQSKDMLERKYGRPLAQIVAVVTPFAAQARAIVRACVEQGISAGPQDGELAVNTVYALQGAERPVVVFSPTYSKHADGNYLDNSPSLLNVTVSRAKDSFLVFGDMDLFERVGGSSPRAQLGTLLRDEQNQALNFRLGQRADLVTVVNSPVELLVNAERHDGFLKNLLGSAKGEVHIVTPWIRPGCVHETKLFNAMADAVARGVAIHVYADEYNNTSDSDPNRQTQKRAQFSKTLQEFKEIGINAWVVRKVHCKIVLADDDVYSSGSFNWFSAYRDPERLRHEVSLVYRGPALVTEIQATKDDLQRQAVKFNA